MVENNMHSQLNHNTLNNVIRLKAQSVWSVYVCACVRVAQNVQCGHLIKGAPFTLNKSLTRLRLSLILTVIILMLCNCNICSRIVMEVTHQNDLRR